jgi:concentrative nucleoside transporter, CNT family
MNTVPLQGWQAVIPCQNMLLMQIGRGLLGLSFLILICYLLSQHKKKIRWKDMGYALLMQIIFAVAVLKIPGFVEVFGVLSSFFVKVLDFTREGSNFLFGNLMDTKSYGFIFAFQVLPTIVFFSALTSALYYLGILQKIVYGFAWVFSKFMHLSGAESLSTAGNIFLGQTEAPLLIKPYLPKMSRSEMLCIMIGGMANIAGGVLAAYVGFLGGDDPVQRQAFATHLLCASIMSAPATILVSKILIPETEALNTKIEVAHSKVGDNLLDSISVGTQDGIQLAINVGAMLLVFTALMAMMNWGVGLFGEGFSLQAVFGWMFAPVAWLVGVDGWNDMKLVGQLMGEKTILNEFYAYTSLAKMKEAGQFVNARSYILATYVLCGFANFASIGIQIGGISAIAPTQRTQLSRLGILALIGGTICTFMTATIVGMIL